MKNFIIFTLISLNVFAQENIYINGKIIEGMKVYDTLLFHNGKLPSELYETSNIISNVQNNKFYIDGKFTYPHMYYLSFFSENSKIPYRKEMYFIDSNTKFLNVSESAFEIAKNNLLCREYYDKFIPFIISGTDFTFQKYRYTQSKEFDLRLSAYILSNNSSYVALWNLAERINTNGYQKDYVENLNNFSNTIKRGKLWIVLNKELHEIKIHLGKKFPKIELKNINLETSELVIPKDKYVFIDFWFSRCRPCLEQIPTLKNIYEKNRDVIEIISISTDKTENIEMWKNRIIEKGIVWVNYLDENGVFSSTEKIKSFPTNYLIDKEGYIIKKNIDLAELEKFLKN